MTFKANYEGIGEMLNSPFMREAMVVRAEAIRTAAEADAATYSDSGEFARSFAPIESGTHGGVHKDRAYAIVRNTDPAALSIEFGHLSEKGEPVEGHYSLTRAAGLL